MCLRTGGRDWKRAREAAAAAGVLWLICSAAPAAWAQTSAARSARRGGTASDRSSGANGGTTDPFAPSSSARSGRSGAASGATTTAEPEKKPEAAPVQGEPLPPDMTKALVIIEGDRGRGSGFVVKMRDQFFIVTNQHVLSGNAKFSATSLDGTTYPTNGPMFAARGYDIAIVRVPQAQYFLEVVPDASAGPLADDAVTVPGNAGGAGVATQTHGKLVGIGPQLVEVDAKFIQGNSGSPIIHRPSGKVLGVATYAVTYKLDDLKKAANVRDVRWFGYRLDNVKNWEAINWQKYSQEGLQLQAAQTLTEDLIGIILDTPDPIKHKELDSAYQVFRRSLRDAAKNNNEDQILRAVSSFVSQIRFLAGKDLRLMSEQPLHSYHAEKVKEQQDIRKSIDKALNEIDKVYRNALNN